MRFAMWRFCFAILLALDVQAQRAPESCERYESAARADSTNAQAWYALGRCAHRDFEMVAVDGDSSRMAFRSSWTTSLRALRRAVAIDPGFARAYRPLLAILFAETRDGCSAATGLCLYVAANLRAADTLITVPHRVIQGPDLYGAVVREAAASRHANLLEASEIAARWASVMPNEPAPHEFFGRALLRLDDPQPAADELERAAQLGTAASRRALFFDRFEALVKANRGADARRVLDEAAAQPGPDSARLAWRLVALDMLVGRVRTVQTAPNPALRARLDSIARSPSPPRAPTAWERFQQAIAKKDNGAARRALVSFDSTILPPPNAMSTAYPQGLLASAQLHLAVADSAGAEARLAELERGLMGRPFQYNWMLIGPLGFLGEAWLLSGALARARGRRAEAERMYLRVIGLWEGGDPTVQPVVREARARLHSLRT